MRKPLASILLLLIASALPGVALAELCEETACCVMPMEEMDCCSMEQSSPSPPTDLVVQDFVKPVSKPQTVAVATSVSLSTLELPAREALIPLAWPTPRGHLAALGVLLI